VVGGLLGGKSTLLGIISTVWLIITIYTLSQTHKGIATIFYEYMRPHHLVDMLVIVIAVIALTLPLIWLIFTLNRKLSDFEILENQTVNKIFGFTIGAPIGFFLNVLVHDQWILVLASFVLLAIILTSGFYKSNLQGYSKPKTQKRKYDEI